MKIALIGTHSTGKTTLLNHLKTALLPYGRKITTVPELARLCPFPINEETTLAAQAWIQEQQIAEEMSLYHPEHILLCDRGTLDNFAYFERAAAGANISAHEERAVRHMRTYDFIFKTTKLVLSAKVDGIRSVDETFRDEIDERITRLLTKHAIRYTLLPSTTNYRTHVGIILSRVTPTLTTRRQY